jgi:aspartate/methionine/tyrosine aminotransferase
MDKASRAAIASARAWVPPSCLEGLFPYPLADVPDIKARVLAKRRSVVLLPGSVMGQRGEGFVRASFAVEEDRWQDAGRRIREAEAL